MKPASLAIVTLALAACDGDQDARAPDAPLASLAREFTMRIENVAPWTVLKASAQRMTTALVEEPLGPRDAYEIRFTAGNHHAVSFVAMLRESNDWFFAPGPEGIPLFENGVAVTGDVTTYVRLWDAGTELDQEPGVGDATGVRQTMRGLGAPDLEPAVREVPIRVPLDDGRTFVRPEVSAMIRVLLIPGPDSITLRIENVSRRRTLVTSAGTMAIHVSPVVWAIHREPAPMFTPDEPARENGLEALAEDGSPDPLATSLGFARGFATPLSPGLAIVHRDLAPLFAPGEPDRGRGLERLAEDGNPAPLLDTLGDAAVGFDTPQGGNPGPAAPGQAFEVVLRGEPGDAVSFATMFGMSNDWFFGTGPEGIALFDGDIPRSCDVTAEVRLYDLGTEVDEELDVGPNTAAQQPAPDSGRPDRVAEVREVPIERHAVPEVLYLRVTLRPSPLE